MNLIRAIILIGIVLGFTNCKIEEEDTIYRTFGNITSIQPNAIVIEINDSTLVYDQQINIDNYLLNDRVLFSYTIIGQKPNTEHTEYEVDIDMIDKIKTENIQIVNDISRDTLTQNAIRIDGIGVQSHYINIQFTYQSYSNTPTFSLTYDENAQGGTSYDLNFMHNSSGESTPYYNTSIICFDLNSIDWQGANPVKIELLYRDFNQEMNYVILNYTRPLE